MADEKISALPQATVVANADILPIVQSGVNKQAVRALLLTAGAGEDITLTAPAGGIVRVGTAGGVLVSPLSGQNLTLASGTAQLQFSGNDCFITFPTGTLTISSGLGGPFQIVMGSSQIFITFQDASGNWSGGVTDMASALQRIAAALAGLLVGPIP